MAGRSRRGANAPPLLWRLGLFVVTSVLRRGLGWRVRSMRPNRMPTTDAPLVVVFNHTSNVDAFLVADTVWRGLRRWCQPLVKSELMTTPMLGVVLRKVGAIPVVRAEGAGRGAAFDDAVGRLHAGGTILLAPEGTITHDGTLLPLRHGAARLALQAGVDVLAVTHFGAQRGFSPVVRFAERGVIVTMAMDLITPLPQEDASSFTGRIAATMLDRGEELKKGYPQSQASARWWPPYSVPASPTDVARQNLERYRQSMAEAVDQARRRMAQLAEGHDVEERVTQVRDRGRAAAEEWVARSRSRTEALAEQTRNRWDGIAGQARGFTTTPGERSATGELGGDDDERSASERGE